MDEGEAKGLLSTVNPQMQTPEMHYLRNWFGTFLKRLKLESSLVYRSELQGCADGPHPPLGSRPTREGSSLGKLMSQATRSCSVTGVQR